MADAHEDYPDLAALARLGAADAGQALAEIDSYRVQGELLVLGRLMERILLDPYVEVDPGSICLAGWWSLTADESAATERFRPNKED